MPAAMSETTLNGYIPGFRGRHSRMTGKHGRSPETKRLYLREDGTSESTQADHVSSS